MSVSLAYTSKVAATETLVTNMGFASQASVSFNGLDTTATITDSTTPAITLSAYFEKTLAAGAGTIDLTALTGANGIAVNGTGLRVQVMKIRNKSTNAAVMVVSKGAANGYTGFGASFSVSLMPGAEALIRTMDHAVDISGTVKNIDIAGTGTEVAEVAIIMG